MRGHVLLTGGAGFIGSATARALLAAGWRVTVLDALTYAGRREHLAGLDLRLEVGDVCDPARVGALARGVDAILHAAAESHVGRSLVDPAPFIRTNIEGTRVVLEAAADAGVAHTVHVSTDEIFGAAPPGVAFQPSAPPRPGNPYAATKVAAEAFVDAVAHTRGYRATVVRATNCYGPRQHKEKAIPCWMRAAAAGRPVPIHGRGEAVRDWLYVEDFARGLVATLERGAPGAIHHFAGGNALPNRALAERVLQLAGGGALALGPDRPGQDARYALDDSATRAALDWRPQVSLDDGLASTWAGYRSQG